MALFIMFYYSIMLICYNFSYCTSENMSSYKLLSNTPTTKYCPLDLKNIYRIYEKHPDQSEISICCASRISNRFMLTEKVCVKKFDPQFIKVQSCNKIIKYHVQALYTPQSENKTHGVLLIEINGIPDTFFNKTTNYYNTFFIENNDNLWEKKQCTIYGTSIKSSKRMTLNYYEKWITVSNNTVTVTRKCQDTVDGNNKWMCPIRQDVQFCEEDIGCPMMCDNKLIGIASQRYNWRTWAVGKDCGNLDVEIRYLFLNREYVNWIKQIIGANP
ncbi:unnamed protein product [Macrosiphum euphorbiae]|uniref:Uncharacterized protein n=2 Tax=Macrosiphum euphorbiae TaxID=13131 RepID=A0AAV0X4S3_9HEMI|nr:unnamed protein product [Macrosiphum euphorbiae]